MATRRSVQLGYDFAENLTQLAPVPISSTVSPGVRDVAPLGQIWTDRVLNLTFVLNDIANGLAVWQQIGGAGAGGGGNFANLTVNPGPTNLTGVFNALTGPSTLTGAFTVVSAGNAVNIATDAAASAIIIGNITAGTGITMNVGAGGWTAQGQAGSQYVLGGGTVGGNIFIGGALQTGQIQVGNSTAGQAVFIAGGINVGANTVNIASAAAGANSTVNILAGNATAGVQTFNLLIGTRAGAANISTGAAAHVTTIGSGTVGNVTHLNSPVTTLPGPVQVLTGAGAPAGALGINVGDIYINTASVAINTRMYICTAAGVWTAFVTVA